MITVKNDYVTKLIPSSKEDYMEAFEELMNRWRLATELHEYEYGDKVVRDSNWIPPQGYQFKLIKENGVNLEVLQPEVPSKRVILMVHGGSYLYRMSDAFIDPMPLYAEAAGGANVVSVDYRVAPKVTYLEMIEDVCRAYEWILDQGYQPSDVIMIGDSSGGGTALASMLYMRDHKYVLPAGIITLSASTNLGCKTKACFENRDVDLVFGSSSLLQDKAELYIQGEDYHNPYISPYYGEFAGFPPMLMQVGEHEMLLDDSRDLAKKAYDQGVFVQVEVYEDMFHDFQVMKGWIKEADLAWKSIEHFMNMAFARAENLPSRKEA